MEDCVYAISQDIAPDCANPVIAGIERKAVIINKADVDYSNLVMSSTRANVVEALPLKSGKKGYSAMVYGDTPFTGTKVTMSKGTYRNTFDNEFAMTILDNSPDVCKNVIDGLANGDYVVVFENKYKNLNKTINRGDSVYQIMGLRQGLNAETIENDKYSEDTDGGWSVLLKETKAPESALFLYKTDMVTTEALFNSLLSTAE